MKKITLSIIVVLSVSTLLSFSEHPRAWAHNLLSEDFSSYYWHEIDESKVHNLLQTQQ